MGRDGWSLGSTRRINLTPALDLSSTPRSRGIRTAGAVVCELALPSGMLSRRRGPGLSDRSRWSSPSGCRVTIILEWSAKRRRVIVCASSIEVGCVIVLSSGKMRMAEGDCDLPSHDRLGCKCVTCCLHVQSNAPAAEQSTTRRPSQQGSIEKAREAYMYSAP